MKKIRSKMKALEYSQDFSHYKSMGIFSDAVLGPIRPNFKLVRDVIVVLVTCKNEKDQIKNEGARVLTTLYPHHPPVKSQSISGLCLSDKYIIIYWQI